MTKVPVASAKRRKEDSDLAEYAHQFIGDRFEQILIALFDLATGAWVEEFDGEDGERRVYRKPPDFRAASYLADRNLGKPTERKEQHTVNENYDYAAALQAKRDAYRAEIVQKPSDDVKKLPPSTVIDAEYTVKPEPEVVNSALMEALKRRRSDA